MLSKRMVFLAAAWLAAARVQAADAMPGAMAMSGSLDASARMAASEVIKVGAPMFNGGDRQGCYHLYHGGLVSLRAFLTHRPELVAVIDAKMAAAKTAGATADKAFALRAALDEVVKQCSAEMKKPLWDRLGGEEGVRAVTKEFLVTAAADKKANIDRNGNYPLTTERVARVEQLVVEFVSSVTGGPLKYSGRDMKNSHAGMGITTAEFNAAAGHLIAALKRYKVPQAEIDELVGLVGGTAKDIVEVSDASSSR
jgi:hemoglobin